MMIILPLPYTDLLNKDNVLFLIHLIKLCQQFRLTKPLKYKTGHHLNLLIKLRYFGLSTQADSFTFAILTKKGRLLMIPAVTDCQKSEWNSIL